MRYITFFGILLATLSVSAQVNFPQDTVEMRLDAGNDIQNEKALYIINNSSSSIDYNYSIIFDDLKGTPNWNVQFCDCENCLENYPTTGSCTGLKAGESWPFAVYVLTENIMDGKHMTIAWVNPNDPTDTDTVTVKTVKGNLLSTDNQRVGKSDFKVSPNPASEQLNIDLYSYQGKSLDVQVVDLSGAVVFNNQVDVDPSGRATVSIENIDQGIYLLTAKGEDKVYTERIVVE